MDPITIGLMLAAVGGSIYSADQAGKSSDEALRWQMARAAEQDRFARASRTDAFGNKISYDQALNEWITNLTPSQKALMFSGETEQRRALTEDAARNRAVRERLYRMGALAEPGLDEAIARSRFDQPESEASTRGKIAQLLTAAKRGMGGEDVGGRQAIRQAGNLPTVTRSPMGDTGSSELAKTLLAARGQALTETGARQGAHASRYGDALNRYASLLGGGGGAPISMPTTAKDLAGQQDEMAKLVASVGASGSANVGRAQEGALKAAMMDPMAGVKTAGAIYGQNLRYGQKSNVGSATQGSNRYSDDLYGGDTYGVPLPRPRPAEANWSNVYGDPWYDSSQSAEGYGWF